MANINKGGRPPFGSEILSVDKTIKFAPSMLDKLNKFSQETGMSVAEAVRRFCAAGLEQTGLGLKYTSVPLLGTVACSDGVEIMPLPEGVTVSAPFPLPLDCYALLAEYDSMVGNNPRTSVPPGSIVFLQSGGSAPPGSTVHATWEENGRTYATLKRLAEAPDGSFYLEPLNPEHDMIVPRDESWRIVGVRVRTLINEAAAERVGSVEITRSRSQAAAKAAREAAGYYQEEADGRRRKRA